MTKAKQAPASVAEAVVEVDTVIANGTNGRHKEGAVVSEIVGRTTSPYTRHIPYRTTVDRTQVDYAWWSRFRRGKEDGTELGGAFARPILNILASWVLGSGVDVDTTNEVANERLSQFVMDELDTLLTWYTDGLALGDSYLIVNADGSLSMAPPDTVEVVTDPFDYSTVLAYRITTKLETVTIVDEYRTDGRTVIIKMGDALRASRPDQIFEFANPTGLMPVVPYHNEREANETHGHPVYEGLLHLFIRYDDLLNKSLDGVEVMGRPIPVSTSDNPENDRRVNATRTDNYTDKEGNPQTETVVDFAELTMLWLKAPATFEFAAPGPFAADSKAMLKTLFYLMLEHTGIPEGVWGGAIASSMASFEAQLPAFVRLIDRWRKALAGPLRDLFQVWYASVALFEFLPVVEDMTLTWPEVTPSDDEILVKKVAQASLDNLLTRETELRVLDLGIEDPAAEVAAAQEEADDEQEKQLEMTLQRLEAQPDTGDDEPVPNAA